LFGKEGNQDEHEKKFNEQLLNKTEHIYVYRVTPYGRKNIYTWYGKYKITGKYIKSHADINNNMRNIIVLYLVKILI
jgi:hypothetical protein